MNHLLKREIIMQYKHIIFDLDGTLIDTEEAILKTWQNTLEEYGYQYTLDEIKVVLGVTTQIGLERLNAKVDDNYAHCWQENYEKYAIEAQFFDGTKVMLKALKEKGCILGIVSSRSYKEYEKYFSMFHLDDYFTYKVLEEDTVKHKPEAEPLLKYMEIAKAMKDECIYIGDMPSDIQCANNAFMASGLVTWNKSGVICDEAKYIFNNPTDLLQL